jgi:hypothetical protein
MLGDEEKKGTWLKCPNRSTMKSVNGVKEKGLNIISKTVSLC